MRCKAVRRECRQRRAGDRHRRRDERVGRGVAPALLLEAVRAVPAARQGEAPRSVELGRIGRGEMAHRAESGAQGWQNAHVTTTRSASAQSRPISTSLWAQDGTLRITTAGRWEKPAMTSLTAITEASERLSTRQIPTVEIGCLDFSRNGGRDSSESGVHASCNRKRCLMSDYVGYAM